MDLSSSWSPKDELDHFQELFEIEENTLAPGPATDPSWMRVTVKKALANVPDGFEAIWQSVLAIWRLKTLEVKLEGDSPIQILWMQHLSAWLVSHPFARGRRVGADC